MKAMMLEKIKESLEKARDASPNLEVKALLHNFCEFIDLYTQKDKIAESHKEEFEQKLQQTYKLLWQKFEDTAINHGLDNSTLQSLLEQRSVDPNDFTSDNLHNFNSLNKEIMSNPQSLIKKLRAQKGLRL